MTALRSLAEKRAFAAGAKAALDAAVERVSFDADHAAVAAEVEVSDG